MQSGSLHRYLTFLHDDGLSRVVRFSQDLHQIPSISAFDLLPSLEAVPFLS